MADPPPGFTLDEQPWGVAAPQAQPAPGSLSISSPQEQPTAGSPPPGYTINPPPIPDPAPAGGYPEPMSWGDWARAGTTAGVRGLGGLANAAWDPYGTIMTPFRTMISPEEEHRYQAAEEPGPGSKLGDAFFRWTGIPEYQPTTPGGRTLMATTQGAIAGAPFGGAGALIGGLSGGAGQTTQELTGDERLAAAASLLPGGATAAAGMRAGTRVTPQMEAAGVNPTIGQAMGGWANRLEQGLSSIPWVGDFIKTGRAGAVEDFNRGAINDALGHVGERLDPATPLGRPAIDEARTTIGNAYDQITPHLSIQFDPQFATGLNNLTRNSRMLSRDHQQQFGNTLQTEVIDRMGGTGNLTGQAFRDAESTLGQLATENRSSPLPADRQYGRLIADLRDELRAQQIRSNPQQAVALQNIHDAYAKLERVSTAAARLGTGLGGQSEPGVFTPAQLTSAVREMDRTIRHHGFARGGALLQDYAEGGRRLLGDTLPDSGTPYRSMAALGTGAGLTGLLADPTIAATIGGSGLAAGLAYSPAGRAAINYFLRRPEQAAAAGLLAPPPQGEGPPVPRGVMPPGY